MRDETVLRLCDLHLIHKDFDVLLLLCDRLEELGFQSVDTFGPFHVGYLGSTKLDLDGLRRYFSSRSWYPVTVDCIKDMYT